MIRTQESNRCWLLITLFLISFPVAGSAETKNPQDVFTWQKLPDLSHPVKCAFVGIHGDTLLVMGGVCSPGKSDADRQDRVADTVSVLEIGQDHWQTGMTLPHPLAYGAAVSTDDGVVITLFLPLIHSLNITSAYEYLEKRFNIDASVNLHNGSESPPA